MLKQKEFESWIKIRISERQLVALREESVNRGMGVSAIIRLCIDQFIDPEVTLQAAVNARTTPILQMQTDVLPTLDAMELAEYGELDSEEQQMDWMRAKKESLDA